MLLFKKQENSTFNKVDKISGRDVLAAFAIRFCLRHCVFLCKGTKLQNSAKPNSRTVCRFPPRYAFSPLIPAVWGFGLGLLGGQGFIGAKASLDPLCRFFVAQSFLPCTELFPVHRAFSCAQSFFLCAELFPVRRAFSCAQSFFQCRAQAQSFFLCTELFPVHRAFSCAQSFLPCTELSVVHRASFWQPLQPWFVKETAFFSAKAQNLR